jgi:hypothetical protein
MLRTKRRGAEMAEDTDRATQLAEMFADHMEDVIRFLGERGYRRGEVLAEMCSCADTVRQAQARRAARQRRKPKPVAKIIQMDQYRARREGRE